MCQRKAISFCTRSTLLFRECIVGVPVQHMRGAFDSQIGPDSQIMSNSW
jgi:hypothetical protein